MNSRSFATCVNCRRSIDWSLTISGFVCSVLLVLILTPFLSAMAGALGESIFDHWGWSLMTRLSIGIGIAVGICLDIILAVTALAVFSLVYFNGWFTASDENNLNDCYTKNPGTAGVYSS